MLSMRRCAVISCQLVTLVVVMVRPGNAVGSEVELAVCVRQLVEAADVYDERRMQVLVEGIAQWEQVAIGPVVRHLNHENANVRWQFLLVAHRMGLADARLFQPLLVRARDRDADVRGAAVNALAKLFPQKRETAEVIEELKKDPQPLTRAQAYDAAWTIGKREGVVVTLIQCLQHRDWMTSRAAGDSLAKIGLPAVSDLQTLSRSPQPAMKVLGLRTLARIKRLPDEVLCEAAKQATNRDSLVRRAAIELLETADERSWPILQTLVRHADDAIRRDAVDAIAGYAHCPAEASQLLMRLLNDRDPYVVVSALRAMGKHRSGELPLRKLRGLLRHDHPDVRAATVATVSQLEPVGMSLRPELEYLAEHEPVDYIRRSVQRLLERGS